MASDVTREIVISGRSKPGAAAGNVSRRTDRVPNVDVHRSMSELDKRIARYRSRAEECLAIAEQVGDERLRAQYMDVAESYLKLAEAELDRAAATRKP